MPSGDGAGIALVRHNGAKALAMLDEIAAIYVPAYAEPPDDAQPLFSREAFTKRTTRQALHPGFALVAARCDEGRLVGFSFGLPFEAGKWWHDVSGSKPAPELVAASKFSVIELVVASSHRGRGLARRLIDTLLAPRPEEYAMLLAHPEAPARKMYGRWGWTEAARVQTREDTDAADALVLRLNQPSTA